MAAKFAGVWQQVKGYLPGACGDRSELDHFAKHGHNKADTEMSSYKHSESDGGLDGGHRIAGTEDYPSDMPVHSSGGGEFESEFGVKGEKIDEWQAGWNVTNAIQVRRFSIYPYEVAFCFSKGVLDHWH